MAEGKLRRQVVTEVSSDTKTEQFHEGSTNISAIMAKYRRTQLAPQRSTPGFYGDFTTVGDYQDTLNRIEHAKASFMTLPAKIRAEFKNNPGKLLEFIDKPENLEKAYELGIIERPQSSDPNEDASMPTTKE